MPPRTSLQSSFSVSSDANNEVVCPLKNHDGTACRKRCLGEKRYRSMQEHIRRAHPENYISKLPATEESFLLMVNTPPSERPQPPPPPPPPAPAPAAATSNPAPASAPTSTPSSSDVQSNRSLLTTPGYPHDPAVYYEDYSSNTTKNSDDLRRGSLLPAAAALAQLHSHRPEGDSWYSEEEQLSDVDGKDRRPKARFASMTLEQQMAVDEPYFNPAARPRELLPSSIARSPPGRSSTLPPVPRSVKSNRPRKSSVTQNARKPKHERTKSKENARRLSYDRKAFSAEPQTAAAFYGKRWEDLIDAAASATEEDSRDLTPVGTNSPPQSFEAHSPPKIYCAACRRLSILKDSYACTECISGFCQECVDVLVTEQARGRIARCPRCGAIGGKFKPFQLDIR